MLLGRLGYELPIEWVAGPHARGAGANSQVLTKYIGQDIIWVVTGRTPEKRGSRNYRQPRVVVAAFFMRQRKGLDFHLRKSIVYGTLLALDTEQSAGPL